MPLCLVRGWVASGVSGVAVAAAAAVAAALLLYSLCPAPFLPAPLLCNPQGHARPFIPCPRLPAARHSPGAQPVRRLISSPTTSQVPVHGVSGASGLIRGPGCMALLFPATLPVKREAYRPPRSGHRPQGTRRRPQQGKRRCPAPCGNFGHLRTPLGGTPHRPETAGWPNGPSAGRHG